MTATLQSQAERVRKEVGHLLSDWKQPTGVTAENIQVSYLYAMARQALETAESIWLLYAEGHHNDCGALARSIFERLLNSRMAKLSPRDACQLIADERHADWEGRDKLKKEIIKAGRQPEAETVNTMARFLEEIEVLKCIGGLSSVAKPNRTAMADKVGLTTQFRGLYPILCLYSHPTWLGSQENDGPIFSPILGFSLYVPLETAVSFYSAYMRNEQMDGPALEIGQEVLSEYFGIRKNADSP